VTNGQTDRQTRFHGKDRAIQSETRFWVQLAKSTPLIGLCFAYVEGTKRWKSTRWYKFIIIPHPTPVCGGHHILRAGSEGGHNQTCQISGETVQGFRCPGGPTM